MWAAPRLAPFIRMAVGCSIRRGTATYHLEMWDDAAMRAALRDVPLDRCGLAFDECPPGGHLWPHGGERTMMDRCSPLLVMRN